MNIYYNHAWRILMRHSYAIDREALEGTNVRRAIPVTGNGDMRATETSMLPPLLGYQFTNGDEVDWLIWLRALPLENIAGNHFH
jgi:hypothetical protein